MFLRHWHSNLTWIPFASASYQEFLFDHIAYSYHFACHVTFLLSSFLHCLKQLQILFQPLSKMLRLPTVSASLHNSDSQSCSCEEVLVTFVFLFTVMGAQQFCRTGELFYVGADDFDLVCRAPHLDIKISLGVILCFSLASMSVYHVYAQCLRRSEESSRSLGTIDSCELLYGC